jgi:hypothetical protein
VNAVMHANANAKMRPSIVIQLSEHHAGPYTWLLAEMEIFHAPLILVSDDRLLT